MITAEQVKDTLAFLVPGFLALKIFALRGGISRRTDFEWTVWSILVAALIGVVLDLFRLPAAERFLPSLVVATAGGLLAIVVWAAWSRIHPQAKVDLSPRAWDQVFREPNWVLITLRTGESVLGWPKVVAESKDTDDLDIYIERCEWVRDDGAREIVSAKGLLIPRSEITRLQILEGVQADEPHG